MRLEEAQRIVWQELVRCTKEVYESLTPEERAEIDAEVEGEESPSAFFVMTNAVLSWSRKEVIHGYI